MRKLEQAEKKKQEELRKLEEMENESWKIGAKDNSREIELQNKIKEKEEKKKERQKAYEEEFMKSK